LIKKATEEGKILNCKDICEALPEYYTLNEKESNYSNCPSLYECIDEINESGEVSHIIIKDNNRFKLGTQKECEDYRQKLYTRAIKLLVKYQKVNAKIEHHGQYKLLSNQLKPIDEESNARKYVDAFVKNTKPLELWEFQELKTLYKDYCYKTGNAPLNLGTQDLIKEIREMEKQI